jgi:hypothetical protein
MEVRSKSKVRWVRKVGRKLGGRRQAAGGWGLSLMIDAKKRFALVNA